MIKLLESIEMQTNVPLDKREIVKTLTERDAIDKTIRYLGMEVYVSDEKKKYRLEDGIENINWKEIKGIVNLSEMTQDDNHMTVTKAEKELWNNKSGGEHTHTADQITEDESHRFTTDEEKNKWNNKSDSDHNHDSIYQIKGEYANKSHTHLATEITEDTEHRFTTDAEKTKWNSKAEGNHNHDNVYSKTTHSHAWGDITDKPSEFTPSSHNQASNTINAMTGYTKPSSTGAITATDDLNVAIGKLEKALDGKQVAGNYASNNHNHDSSYAIKNHTHTASNIGTYTKEEIDNKIEEYKIKKYGVKFSGSNPKGVRTYDAVGLVANVGVDDEIVVNDFDKISFYNRPVCCGHHDENGNFIVHAYEGEPGFKRDGSNGEVYYECTPFYWNGSYEEPVVSADKFEDSILAPMFRNDNEKIYLPCYWASTVDGKYVSRSGLYPTFSSANGHMDFCRKTNKNAHTETIKAHMSEYILQLIEFATKDLQSVMMGSCNMIWENTNYVTTIATTNQNYVVMATDKAQAYVVGQTIVTSSNWTSQRTITKISYYDADNSAIYFENQPVISVAKGAKVSTFPYKTGATDNVKASSGSHISNTDGKHQCKWRGKEAPWADSFSILCDILRVIENGKHYPYYLPDPKKYNNGTLTSDYVKLGYEVPSTGGYAKNLGINKHYPFAAITKEIGADSATFLSAYYWTSANPVTVAFVGGDWDDGRDCSPVYFHLGSAPSGSYVDRLARLFVTPV